MVKRKLTVSERIRRLMRIIRFLHSRGTLFRARRPERKDTKPKKNLPGKKSWRPLRKMRFLLKRGTLFSNKRQTPLPVIHPASKQQTSRRKSGFSLYRSYRRFRFLASTGRLFKKRKRRRPVRKKKPRTIRLISFLIRKGILWKVIFHSIGYYVSDFFNVMLRPDYLKIIMNSTILFLLAYLAVFPVVNFSSSLVALTYDIKSVIYYFKIDYLISAKGWSVDEIKVVFSTGPFFSLVLSLLVLVLYINIAEEKWMIKLFLFWVFCHAFTHFFGEMLVGILLTKGFGLSVAYMFISEYKELILILVCLGFLITAGLLMTKLALFSGNIYFNMITRENRPYFLQGQFLIPYILGFGIVVLMKMPKITELDLLINLSMLLMILPLTIRGVTMKAIYFDPEKRKITANYNLLFLLAIMLVLFRVIFSEGFTIG